MVSCEKCGVENPLDGKFCKKCGVELSDSVIEQAKQNLAKLVEDGHLLFTEGSTEEAVMIADTAIQSDPSYAAAFSLKALCLERLGKVAEALECYEKATVLNPSSSLDRVKMNALRNRLALNASQTNQPDRKRAMITALAVCSFVAVAGSLAALAVNHNSAPLTTMNQGSNSTMNPFSYPTNNGSLGVDQSGLNPSAQTNPSTGGAVGNSAIANPSNTNTIDPSSQVTKPNDKAIPWPPAPNGSSGALPIPDGQIGSQSGNTPLTAGNLQVQPIVPNVIPNNSSNGGKSNPGSIDPNGDPNPTISPAKGNSPVNTTAPDPNDDPGTIEITVGSTPSSPNKPGTVSSGNDLQALRKAAADQLQLGNFKAAIASYSRLARYGGDSGRIEQNLGYCYSKVSQQSNAISAYQKASILYENAIKQGISVPTNKTGLAICKQELKILTGG